MFLLQQPEVHLHPSAQAALGSLFCATAASGRQIFVETHSEYILDRIRMDVRDRRTDLTPEDVSVLFFEREDLNVRIHSLRFDDLGNVLDAPRRLRKVLPRRDTAFRRSVMCAIVDTNVAHEVFGDASTPAGKGFFDWLSSPGGQLVVGGRLRAELGRDNRLRPLAENQPPVRSCPAPWKTAQ